MKNENHAKDLNRHLIIKDIQMTNKPMKRHSTSLIIREVQVRTIKIKMLWYLDKTYQKNIFEEMYICGATVLGFLHEMSL